MVCHNFFMISHFGKFWWQKILVLQKSAFFFFCLIFSQSEISVAYVIYFVLTKKTYVHVEAVAHCRDYRKGHFD